MKSNIKFVALTVLVTGVVCAMPTKQEITETRPLVAELMAPVLADLKAKIKTHAGVADVSVGFAESAKTEAARYLFLRGAISYYIRGRAYGKAADTVDALKAKVSDVPPSEIVEIITRALGRENARKAPRLQMQLVLAQTQMKAAQDMRSLAASLRQVSTDPLRRQYAEALAVGGDWKSALVEFAKISGNVGKVAKGELDGSSKAAELGDFWWGFETAYAGAECIFKERAANYYRKAIAEGQIDGLKKTLAEQRLASLSLPEEEVTSAGSRVTRDRAGRASRPLPAENGRAVSTKPSSGGRVSPRAAKNPSGLVHRWSFTDGFTDSVGGVAPSKSDNATVENGTVALRSGSPLEFPAGTVPLSPFTVQVWASATEKGLGSGGDDFIFKLAPSAEGKNDSIFWRWTANKKWFSRFGGFGKEQNCYADNGYLLTGKPNLYTLTAEKDGKGMLLKFYRDDTVYGTLKTEFAYKKPPALILGGFVTPTYDEVRIYSRALPHAEIIKSLNEGPERSI